MKICFISDTHGQHEKFKIPECDVVCHTGDVSMSGSKEEVESFLGWFSKISAEKVFIAGNHDFLFQDYADLAEDAVGKYEGIAYLKDSSFIIDGVKFYGSPWQPWFHDWAFNLDRGESIKKMWDKIPKCDVLLTHGPPMGILDRVWLGENVGCEELLAAVGRVRPKIHAFGHIHENTGVVEEAGIRFVNSAVLSERYRPYSEPIVVEL